MRINHNISALNTWGQMENNSANASKSLEKLSSGQRINRAGDDAAGLAISEKMRGQIRGLDMASKNAQDSVSLIQTAEGGLTQTHDVLQRMRELSVQSANDTNTLDDRKKIQGEVDSLAKEVTRISNATEFNTQNLLGGGLKTTFHIGANQGQNLDFSISAMDAKSLGVAGDMVTSAFSGTNGTGTNVASASADMARLSGADGVTQQFIVVTKMGKASEVSGANVSISNAQGFSGTVGITQTVSTIGVSGGYTGAVDKTFVMKIDALSGGGTGTGANAKVTGASYSTDGGVTWTKSAMSGDSAFLSDNVKFTFNGAASTSKLSGARTGDTFTFTAKAAYKTAQLFVSGTAGRQAVGSSVKVYSNMTSVAVGDAAFEGTDPTVAKGKVVTVNFNYRNVAEGSGNLNQAKTESKAAQLATDGSTIAQAQTQKGIDVTSQDAANKAITSIDNAIRKVSEERSKLGSYQNRLEYTNKNLGVSSENLTAAESRIRDTDMAKEMMSLTKNNVLVQAAQSMMAQANQQSQGVLGLLR